MQTSAPQAPTEGPGPEAGSGKLYTDLASWWHLLSAPADHAEAAAFYWDVIRAACASVPETLLELGSGGGNTASFLKRHSRLTLVDLSPQMLGESQSINPECEHVVGDMRSVRLGRLFDAVFVQDAISHMLTEADLEQAIQTAFIHCRPGGVALFAPDYVRETFRSATSQGGHDGDGRGMRYLEWTWDPNPADTTYLVDLAYLLREASGALRVVSDRLQLGLFRRADWMRIIGRVGFAPRSVPFGHEDVGPGSEVFVAIRPPQLRQ